MKTCPCGKPIHCRGQCTKCYENYKKRRSDSLVVEESSGHPDVFRRRFAYFNMKMQEAAFYGQDGWRR